MDIAHLLRLELDRQGVKDNSVRAAIAAIVGGESGFKPHSETPYTHTNNARIRSIFRSALGDKSDSFINDLKRDPEAFFNYVYGVDTGVGLALGNDIPGDGWRFRGRGPAQLTGRFNYMDIGKACGHPEILDDPELVNDPDIGVAVTVAYALKHYRGGGWEGMKRAWGNSVGPVDARKDQLFILYQQSGEFNYTGAPAPNDSKPGGTAKPLPEDPAVAADEVPQEDRKSLSFAALRAIQLILAGAGFYNGDIDADFGLNSRSALNDALQCAHQKTIT